MSELPSNLRKQRQSGFVLLTGAAAILLGGFAVGQYYGIPPVAYLGLLVPIAILTFFGYRNLSATRSKKALHDERTVELHGKVGLNSFWWLMSIILFDNAFGIFPEDGAATLYIFAGLIVYGLYFGYYRYIE